MLRHLFFVATLALGALSPPESANGAVSAVLQRPSTAASSAVALVSAETIPADEATFVSMINQLRTSQGLNSLTVDGELRTQARQWTQVMADSNNLHHASDLSVGISADWRVLGENVGVHSVHDLDALFQAFVNSPSHYANLVDSRFTHVGVGVMKADNGDIWTTHRFMSVGSTSPPTPPTTTTATAPAQPTTPSTETQASGEDPTPSPDSTTASPTEPTGEAPNGSPPGGGADEQTTGTTASTAPAADGVVGGGSGEGPQLDRDLIGDIIEEVATSGL